MHFLTLLLCYMVLAFSVLFPPLLLVTIPLMIWAIRQWRREIRRIRYNKWAKARVRYWAS